MRPCLPVAFAEGLEGCVCWAEDVGEAVNVGNVHANRKDRACLKLPDRMNRVKRKRMALAFNNIGGMSRNIPPIDGQRITGLGCTSDEHRVFVYTATTSLLSRHVLLKSWTPELHSKFTCKKHNKAIKQVLLGTRSSSNLRLLPEPILLKILAGAAFPTEAWA